jgi:group I intron endonuclease
MITNTNTNNRISSGIYCIRNTITGYSYIGSSQDINKRCVDHSRGLENSTHFNIHLQRSWNKYGSINFIFSTIELVSDIKRILIAEQFWLDEFRKSFPNHMFNISLSAKAPMRGRTFTKKQKQNLSRAMSGHIRSKEHRKNLSLANKGQVIPEWQKDIISKANKGRAPWNKGKIDVYSKETLDSMSKQRLSNPIYHKHTEETKRKISESQKGKGNSNFGRVQSIEERKKRSLGAKLFWKRRKEKEAIL